MATNENTNKWLRLLLGLFLVVYGLNQFFHFFPTGYGDMPEDARDFIDGVAIYLPFLYIFEILIGLLLIFNKWVSLVLIVLFPLSVSFLIFHFSNFDILQIWPALLVAGLNLALLLERKETYRPLFT